MEERQGHRKRVRHYHDPVHVHELTFSCFRRLPLLKNAIDWNWSSARHYITDTPRQYPELPTISRLPAEWLDAPV